MPLETLTPDDLDRIFSYLDQPVPAQLPTPPIQFLSDHIDILPSQLLLPFNELTSPRERASIPTIKARRHIYATQQPLPPELRADRARLRWPLLWERTGGSSLPPPSIDVTEEERWAEEHFLPGKENSQHVKKLGGFLRGLAEEREAEEMVMAKRAERRLDQIGEEFDDESDEEEQVPKPRAMPGLDVNQEEVRRSFEKRILELFVDGMDTVSYAEVDFTEPLGGDPIAAQDQADAYFDEEDPSRTPNGHEEGQGRLVNRTGADPSDRSTQNGQGEYDY